MDSGQPLTCSLPASSPSRDLISRTAGRPHGCERCARTELDGVADGRTVEIGSMADPEGAVLEWPPCSSRPCGLSLGRAIAAIAVAAAGRVPPSLDKD